MQDGTELGRTAKQFMDEGGLVREVIIGVIGERVEGPESADGFILDGFPRTNARLRRSARRWTSSVARSRRSS